MRYGSIFCITVAWCLLMAGCTQLTGVHIISDTTDPIISHWIGGELPLSDRHIIFYENRTYFSVNFFLGGEEVIESGTWTKEEKSLYTTNSRMGNMTSWVYDSFDDSVYISGLPQLRYHRYKG